MAELTEDQKVLLNELKYSEDQATLAYEYWKVNKHKVIVFQAFAQMSSSYKLALLSNLSELIDKQTNEKEIHRMRKFYRQLDEAKQYLKNVNVQQMISKREDIQLGNQANQEASLKHKKGHSNNRKLKLIRKQRVLLGFFIILGSCSLSFERNSRHRGIARKFANR